MFNSLIDNNIYRTSLLLVCFLLSFSAFSTEANDEKLKDAAITGSTNSTEVQNPISKNDSLPKDSINAKQKKESLNSEVNYSAADSVVFYAGGIAYLYGDAKVDYEEMSLTSNRIRINMDSTLVQARCGVDSTGETIRPSLQRRIGRIRIQIHRLQLQDKKRSDTWRHHPTRRRLHNQRQSQEDGRQYIFNDRREIHHLRQPRAPSLLH